jgi:hypothetical protein
VTTKTDERSVTRYAYTRRTGCVTWSTGWAVTESVRPTSPVARRWWIYAKPANLTGSLALTEAELSTLVTNQALANDA